MAPKKKNKPNAVYFFAKDYQAKNNIKGPIYDTIASIYPLWQDLPEDEKERYKQMALDHRETQKQQLSATDTANSMKEEKLEIETILDKIGREMSNESIEDQHWYMIKFLSLCRCDEAQEEYDYTWRPYYVLAEVGLIEYQLSTGILNEYHTFIETTKIPLGYYAICKENSERYRISFGKDSNLPVKSHSLVYKEICEFIKKKAPIFCMREDISETQFALEYLRKSFQATSDSDIDGPFNDDVYGLDVLTVRLAQNKLNLNVKSAHEVLTKYTYDYSSNTKCDHHDETDTLHCALGLVKRRSYLISDYICPLYNIRIDANTRHLPVEKSVGIVLHDELADFKCSHKRPRYDDPKPSKHAKNDSDSEDWNDVAPRGAAMKSEPKDYDNFRANNQPRTTGSFSKYMTNAESNRSSIGRGKRYFQH